MGLCKFVCYLKGYLVKLANCGAVPFVNLGMDPLAGVSLDAPPPICLPTSWASASNTDLFFPPDSQPVVHVITSRGQEWTDHEVSVEASPTIIYQDVSGESQSATSTIKALLELQQTTGTVLQM